MKKILLIICLVFCIFFIKIDVKAELVCTPYWTYQDEYSYFKVNFSYEDDSWIVKLVYEDEYYVGEDGKEIDYSLSYKDGDSGDEHSSTLKVSDNLLTKLREGEDFSDKTSTGIGLYFLDTYSEAGTLKYFKLYYSEDRDFNESQVMFNCSGTNDHPNASAPAVGKADQTTNEDNEVVNECTYHLTTNSNIEVTTSTVVLSNNVIFNGGGILGTFDDKLINIMSSDGNENCPDFYVDQQRYAHLDKCLYCDKYSTKIVTYVEPDNNKEKKGNYTDIWSPDLGKGDCSAVEKIANDVNNYILIPLRYIVPIIFLIMTIIDFAKSVFVREKSSDGKDISKAKNNLLRRVIISVIVYFIPNIVLMLFNLFGLVCEQPTAMILQNILFMLK